MKLISPIQDRVFLIFSPILALALAFFGSKTNLVEAKYLLYGRSESVMSLFSGVFTMAHLGIVFFRSHGNPLIFQKYPLRFIGVPILLFVGMLLSSWFLVFIFVLAIWWDVYHSSLQTFGLGRLYDARIGNDADTGRSLDYGLNLIVYIVPILTGAAWMDHLIHFQKFGEVNSLFLAKIPSYGPAIQSTIRVWALLFSAIYLMIYGVCYWRLYQKGYRVSTEKVLLIGSTALTSIWAWGFNAFGQAFFIMNFFHALQYFALIWWAEQKQMHLVFGLPQQKGFRPFVFGLFVGTAVFYGAWAKFYGESTHATFSLLLTVSILHFWYDGFIWSVRAKQVSF